MALYRVKLLYRKKEVSYQNYKPQLCMMELEGRRIYNIHQLDFPRVEQTLGTLLSEIKVTGLQFEALDGEIARITKLNNPVILHGGDQIFFRENSIVWTLDVLAYDAKTYINV